MKLSADMISAIPHFDQYVGVWSMHEPTFQALFDHAKTIDITAHLSSDAVKEVMGEAKAVAGAQSASGAYRTVVQDGVAVIRANGTLMKHASSMTGGSSTVMLRQAIRTAMQDPSVGSILLVIESPGGTAAGTYELAQTIQMAAAMKPVISHIEDLGASAAYWIAAATQSIAANAPAMVGSIGTYAVIQDLSALAAKEGVKVHVVRAGAFKGFGEPGTEITADQLAMMQERVNGVNEFFLIGVMEGRKMNRSQVETLADGRVHSAAKAKELGLIDKVQTFEQSFSDAVALAAQYSQKKGKKMSDTQPTPQAATIQEIKAACPGITSDKLVSYLEANKTIDQAKDAWMQELALDLAAKSEELAKAKSEADALAAKAAAPKIGVEPITEKSSSTAGDARGAWNQAIDEHVKSGMSRVDAIKAVNRRSPELRSAMLADVSRN